MASLVLFRWLMPDDHEPMRGALELDERANRDAEYRAEDSMSSEGVREEREDA